MSRAERVICEAEGGRSRERNEYPAKYEELLNQEFGFKARNDPHDRATLRSTAQQMQHLQVAGGGESSGIPRDQKRILDVPVVAADLPDAGRFCRAVKVVHVQAERRHFSLGSAPVWGRLPYLAGVKTCSKNGFKTNRSGAERRARPGKLLGSGCGDDGEEINSSAELLRELRGFACKFR